MIEGDPSDPEFLVRVADLHQLELILLATGRHRCNVASVAAIRRHNVAAKIAATAVWPDEAKALRQAGADLIFSIYGDASVDFAHHAHEKLCSRPAA